MPTRLAREVYSLAMAGVSSIARDASVTPGQEGCDKSRWFASGLVGVTAILPRTGRAIIVRRRVAQVLFSARKLVGVDLHSTLQVQALSERGCGISARASVAD
jgi:hypothetical protein